MPREQGRPGKSDLPPDPWRSFLRELDERLTQAVELHCIGGFVVAVARAVAARHSAFSDAEAALAAAEHRLERSRLAREDSLARESMPAADDLKMLGLSVGVFRKAED